MASNIRNNSENLRHTREHVKKEDNEDNFPTVSVHHSPHIIVAK